MGDEITRNVATGDNSNAELKRRIDRRVELLDEMAELQEQLKDYKDEDKSDGFTERAIVDAVKLRRVNADRVLATLTLEAEKTVYRKAAGIATDIETAAKLAQSEAESVPEPKRKGTKKTKNDGGFH